MGEKKIKSINDKRKGWIDLEINPAGKIYAIGALLCGAGDLEKNFIRHCRGGDEQGRKALAELDDFLAPAELICGHNIISHDLPALELVCPDLSLLEKPVIDTLYISPLAFPENPYHRLIKDYKLVRDTLNDPLADSRLARELFNDQIEVFFNCLNGEKRKKSTRASFYGYCFRVDEKYKGISDFFSDTETETEKINSFQEAESAAHSLIGHLVCRQALADYLSGWLKDSSHRISMAYVVAWLGVAGGSSVLPPWVLHRFAETTDIIHKLRDSPCSASAEFCSYCRNTHNPVKQLTHFFAFPSFRATPAHSDGSSLQERVVESAMAAHSLLAILPTGGGKSLCFQLPALVRHRRCGLLTIVISPLQALMKDQVDNLRSRTGSLSVTALYGMLTAPQRGEVLKMVAMGDAAILYVSPEQLRNHSFLSAIKQRQIGAWVFDEAHCLSKWGHDFRTDYVYAARFIREFSASQGTTVPPVQCFTATAKKDVRDEIIAWFREQLGLVLNIFEATVERENLHFEVQEASGAGKYSRVAELLAERMEEGAAIVYCATRRGCEQLADFLKESGFEAEAFHAGLEPPLKESIQERFVAGTIRVICATNAFGMGIDKENVRLVIHADIPGSLENYLQEAGRAGRDLGDADCVLLFDRHDIETQFRLNSFSQLSKADIAQILRGLRSARRNPDGNVVLTPHELLRSDRVETSFDLEDRNAATKVKTAVSWLERAGMVERNENMTKVFQGRPRVKSMEEAEKKMGGLGLSATQKQSWLTIIETLMNAESDESFSADQLGELLPVADGDNQGKDHKAGKMVLRTLYDMANKGLIHKTTLLSAFIRFKVKSHSRSRLKKISALEKGLLELMEEQAPDAQTNDWQTLSLRLVNQSLLDRGFADSNPESLRNLLVSMSLDGQGLAGGRGSLELRRCSTDGYRLKLQRDWLSLRKTAKLRTMVADSVLNTIHGKVAADTPPSAQLLIEFSGEELIEGLRANLFLRAELKDYLAAMDRGLMFLHEQKVIILQQGLAVFHQAMTIKVNPEKRQYTKGDFAPLEHHYSERVFQVHVMHEYARQGTVKIAQALRLIMGYFSMDRSEFIRRFFAGREKALKRATSHESFVRIVEELHNSEQQSLVAAGKRKNLLVLAGPGAGKTRVVVHRCDYLLRVKRVRATAIIVLCFNRSAVSELRSRLKQLVGSDSVGVAISTYHSLALRLTGQSPLAAAGNNGGEEPYFDTVMAAAVELLKGEREVPGLEEDEYREKILGGYEYILVDEYQDIDRSQYELISALSGRNLGKGKHKLNIMAVGDDDQNIYSFRGSGVEFIRRFKEDYQAEVRYLVENYRSSSHIIAAANKMIETARQRMKKDYPIRTNRGREKEPAGGEWERFDDFGRGRVQVIRFTDTINQVVAVVESIKRLSGLAPVPLPWNCFAVLGRDWRSLSLFRSLCEEESIPVNIPMDRDSIPPLHRIREFFIFIKSLKEREEKMFSAEELLEIADSLSSGRENRWHRQLRKLVSDWQAEVGEDELPKELFFEFLFDSLREQRREQQVGEGVFGGTVHAAKGLEFAHVFILDDSWLRAVAGHPEKLEEERRLYYVAMTRAMETLTLMEDKNKPNPFASTLDGDFILRTDFTIGSGETANREFYRYTTLKLNEIDLGYGGRKYENHPIHSTIAGLETGSELQMIQDKDERVTFKAGSVSVAALSRRAAPFWQGKLDSVVSVRVTGLFYRFLDEVNLEYRKLYKVKSWEVPLLEIVSRW